MEVGESQPGVALREAGWTMSGSAMICPACSIAHRAPATPTVATASAFSPGPAPARQRSFPRRHGRLGAVVAVVAAGIAAAFVAAGSGGPANLDPVALAADSTLNAGGAHFSLRLQMQPPGLGAPLTISGTGYLNGSPLEGTMSLHSSALPGNAAAGLPAGVLQLDMVFKGFTYYMRMPTLATQLPGGKSWMKFDVSKALHQQTGSALNLGAGTGNPTQFLQMLRDTHASVVGQARIRGVPTTEYRGTLDLSALADHVPDNQRALVKAGVAALTAEAGTSTLAIDVWIDSSHRVRRFRISTPAGAATTSPGFDLTMSMYDFGAHQTVTAPADSDVFDATSLATGALGVH